MDPEYDSEGDTIYQIDGKVEEKQNIKIFDSQGESITQSSDYDGFLEINISDEEVSHK